MTSHSRRFNHGRSAAVANPRHSRGFTLLEVLLTSLLAAVVLVSLWSLADIYLKLFVVGKQKIEETQLVRGLTEKIAKDLLQVTQLASPEADAEKRQSPIDFVTSSPARSANQMTPPTEPPRSRSNSPFGRTNGMPRGIPPIAQPTGSAPVMPNATGPLTPGGNAFSPEPIANDSMFGERISPRFGLFGTDRALRLIVLQTDPRTAREPSDLAELLIQPGSPRPAVATEIRTIEYSFVDPEEAVGADTARHPAGLVRREWAWETWSALRQLTTKSSGSNSDSSMLPDPVANWTDEDSKSLETGIGLFHIEQVVGLEFQYYDGEEWLTEWDSWEQQRLPVLVEVVLQIDVSTKPSAATSKTTTSTESSSDDSESDSSTASGTEYRRLIALPFGAIPKSAPAVKESASSGAGLVRSQPRSEGRRR